MGKSFAGIFEEPERVNSVLFHVVDASSSWTFLATTLREWRSQWFRLFVLFLSSYHPPHMKLELHTSVFIKRRVSLRDQPQQQLTALLAQMCKHAGQCGKT
mmetsp:Transcript_7362/g.14100  ORF Transcript_7362/g.14100 Transcript_7362/m.14100 type:complete len:101 (+) Transcript_7362:24-326(+)